MMRRSNFMLVLFFVLSALGGYWLASTAVPKKAEPKKVVKQEEAKRWIIEEAPIEFKADKRGPQRKRALDGEAIAAGAITGQRTLLFKDRAALEDFLKRAGDKVKVLGRLDALNALRVSFLNYGDLAGLLDGNEELGFIFPVDLPTPPDATAQQGAVALGAELLEWLGITTDNSEWGKGVGIAILDTGVTNHPAFSANISSLNLIGLPEDLSKQNGHGTGVASMIIGSGTSTPGVAPGASVLSIRVANDLGQSDSFLLAQGITAAVDQGVQIINISLASAGDSALVRAAIEYANQAGILIVAAVGNNGLTRVSYPAANNGVIAVGAVDAVGNHLNFSNTGTQVAVSAPGYGINAAWANGQATSVDGTSFSSPIIAGAIAALINQPGQKKLSPHAARDLLFSYLNDGGEAGADPALGRGTPDLGRVLNRNRRGIYDAAVGSQRVLPSTPGNPYGQVEVLVQNRGTEVLTNTIVQISTPGGVVNANVNYLPINGVQTVRVPILRPPVGDVTLRYESSVILSGGFIDSKNSNNRRVEVYAPVTRSQ